MIASRPRMIGAIDQVLFAQHRDARDHDRAGLERAHIGRLPERDARQRDHHRVAALDAEAGQHVGDAVGLLTDIGEGQTRAIAVLILPQHRRAARLGARRTSMAAPKLKCSGIFQRKSRLSFSYVSIIPFSSHHRAAIMPGCQSGTSRAAIDRTAAIAALGGRRLRSFGGGPDVFQRHRRKIVASDLHVDDREVLPRCAASRALAQFGRGVRLEARAAPVLAKSRIRPRRDIEQVAPLGRHRPEDAPSAIIDHDHDRIGAEARRVRNFRPVI